MNERIVAYVRKMHEGQVDKAGKDYFSAHLMPVAQAAPPRLQHIALAHDLLEDTRATLEDMYRHGFTEFERWHIEILTHREGESYEQYIRRISVNATARTIKRLDIANNLGRAAELDIDTFFRLNDKYAKALVLLDEAEGAKSLDIDFFNADEEMLLACGSDTYRILALTRYEGLWTITVTHDSEGWTRTACGDSLDAAVASLQFEKDLPLDDVVTPVDVVAHAKEQDV